MKTFTCFHLKWFKTGSLNHQRRLHAACILSNGKVLVTGGIDHGVLYNGELYDPSTETWKTIGSMNDARMEHTASVLMGGKVLVTGGEYVSTILKSAELYQPL